MKCTLMSTYYVQVDLSTLILTIIPWDANYYLHEVTLRVAQLPNGTAEVWPQVWLPLELLVPNSFHYLCNCLLHIFLYLFAKSPAKCFELGVYM